LEAVAGRQYPIARGRRAAALNVPEDRNPRLVSGALLDLAGKPGANATLRQPHVPEFVDVALLGQPLELVALADHDDREVLATLVAAADVVAGLLDRDRVLRDQDHVRSAGDPAHDRD